MGENNPCNICKTSTCDDCILERIYNKVNYCEAYDCFCNYEGNCNLSLYDDCGCRKSFARKDNKRCTKI